MDRKTGVSKREVTFLATFDKQFAKLVTSEKRRREMKEAITLFLITQRCSIPDPDYKDDFYSFTDLPEDRLIEFAYRISKDLALVFAVSDRDIC